MTGPAALVVTMSRLMGGAVRSDDRSLQRFIRAETVR